MVFKLLQRLGNFFKQRAGPTVNPGFTPKIKDAQQTTNPGVGRSLEEKPNLKTATDNLHSADASFKRDFAHRLQTDVESTAATGNKLDTQSFQSTTGSKDKISPDGQTGACAANAAKDVSEAKESQSKFERSNIGKTEQLLKPAVGVIREPSATAQMMGREETLSKEDSSPVVAATQTKGFINDKANEDAIEPSIAETETKAKIIQKVQKVGDFAEIMSDSRESTTANTPISPAGEPVGLRSKDAKVSETSPGIAEAKNQNEESTKRETNSFVSAPNAREPLPRDGVLGKSPAEADIKKEDISTTVNVGIGATYDPLKLTTIDERIEEDTRSEETAKLSSDEKPGDLGIPKTSKSSRSKDQSKQTLESAKESKKEKSPKTRSVKATKQGIEEKKAINANEITEESALSGEKSESGEAVPKKKQKKEPKAIKDPNKPKKTSRSSKKLEAAPEDVGKANEITTQAREEAKTSKTGKSQTGTKRKVKVAGPGEDAAQKTGTKAKADSKK